MKKLLIFMLVLCMASLANATLQISVNGDKDPIDSEIWLLPSETLILDVWTVDPIPGALTWALGVDTSLGTISGGMYVGPLDGGNILAFIYDDAVAMGVLMPAGENGVMGGVMVFAGAGVPGGADLYDEIIFHCEAEEYDTVVTLYLVDDMTNEVTAVDSVIIHNIPEPMTVLLLGLGGLFLRRRK